MHETQQTIYICFVDYEKVIDRMNWMKMMHILKNIGVDWRDRKLIQALYATWTKGQCSH